jgi:hypothetical protein
VRTAEIELPEPYEGWRATIRTNIPMATYNALVGGTWKEKAHALIETILEWNYVDDEGEPIPLEPAALRTRLGFDEVKLTVAAIDQAIGDFLRQLSTRD